MGRKESALSLELERSMNMQVRVETFEEHLRHAGETVWMMIGEGRALTWISGTRICRRGSPIPGRSLG